MRAHLIGKFSPLHIPGCALWLEADRGVTLVDGKVSAWADQSGNGRNASQANAALRPAYLTNNVNGRPIIQSSYGAATNFDVGITLSGTETTIYVILKQNVTGGYQCIATGSGVLLYMADGGYPDLYYSGNYQYSGSISGWNIITFRWKSGAGGFSGIAVNGGAEQTFVAMVGGSWTKLLSSASSQYLQANVAAIIIYSGLLATAQDRAFLGFYSRKYNIALAA